MVPGSPADGWMPLPSAQVLAAMRNPRPARSPRADAPTSGCRARTRARPQIPRVPFDVKPACPWATARATAPVAVWHAGCYAVPHVEARLYPVADLGARVTALAKGLRVAVAAACLERVLPIR